MPIGCVRVLVYIFFPAYATLFDFVLRTEARQQTSSRHKQAVQHWSASVYDQLARNYRIHSVAPRIVASRKGAAQTQKCR